MKAELIKFSVEITDTFCGEANYSWVKRFEFTAPDNASNKMLIRRAKSISGWCIGANHKVFDFGGDLSVKPYGVNQIMFINCIG